MKISIKIGTSALLVAFGISLITMHSMAVCNAPDAGQVTLTLAGPEYVGVGTTNEYTLIFAPSGVDITGGTYAWSHVGFTAIGSSSSGTITLVSPEDHSTGLNDKTITCDFSKTGWFGSGDCSGEKSVTVIEVDFDVTTAGVSGLIDNHEAEVAITVRGGVSPGDLSFSFSTNPKAIGSYINNNKGTSISFSQTSDPLIWRTSEVYWFGLLPDKTCWNYHSRYQFVLEVGGFEIKKDFVVEWPKEKPEMIGRLPPRSKSIVYPAEAVPGIANFYKSVVEFNDYQKTCGFKDVPTSDQYSLETTREEEYHAEQWLGTVLSSEGGQGDCFTAEGIQYAAGWVGNGPWSVYGGTPIEAETLADDLLYSAEEDEEDTSWDIVDSDKGFMELKAKEYAGYNAAWTYECTYQDNYDSNPINHYHPAHWLGGDYE